jgi:hypothetical protein
MHKLTDAQLSIMDNLASINCRDYTIAEVLGIDVKTLKSRYSKRMIQKRAIGRVELRKLQVEKGKTGDTAMLIWRGKNDLGQTDKQERLHGVTDALGELLKEVGSKGAGLPIKE